MSEKSVTRKGIFFASATAFLWGFLAIVLKVSLKNFSPIDVTWIRFVIAFILLSIYLLIKKPTSFKIIRHPPLLLILAAVCLGLNYIGFISGINLTTPGIAQIFIQTGPVLLAISGFLFFKEKATIRQAIGLLIVFGGLAVFYRNQILELAEDVNKYQLGVLWTIFGAVMWASYAVLQKKLVRTYDPLELNLILFGLPAIGYLPGVNFHMLGESSMADWGILLFLGCNTLLAYGSLAYAFKYLEANKVSVIITFNPIITISAMSILAILDVKWIAHERFTLISLIGAFLVLTGASLTIMAKRKKNEK